MHVHSQTLSHTASLDMLFIAINLTKLNVFWALETETRFSNIRRTVECHTAPSVALVCETLFTSKRCCHCSEQLFPWEVVIRDRCEDRAGLSGAHEEINQQSLWFIQSSPVYWHICPWIRVWFLSIYTLWLCTVATETLTTRITDVSLPSRSFTCKLKTKELMR